MWEIRLYGSRRTEKCALFGHTLGYSTVKKYFTNNPSSLPKTLRRSGIQEVIKVFSL